MNEDPDDDIEPYQAGDGHQGDQPFGDFEEDELLEVHDEDGDGPEAYEARDWGDYGDDDTNSIQASDIETSITETPTATFEDVASSSLNDRELAFALPNVMLKRKKKNNSRSSATTFRGPLLELDDEDDA